MSSDTNNNRTHRVPLYRTQGNGCFSQKDYDKATDLYSKGIEHGEENQHLLYSNRSASKLMQGNSQGSLEDALVAIQLDPGYVKGHLRRGFALMELARYHEAVSSFRRAKQLKPDSDFLEQQLERAKTRAHEQDKTEPIQRMEHFRDSFDIVECNPRLRLASMIMFWNLCDESTRYQVFKEFLHRLQSSEDSASSANDQKDLSDEGAVTRTLEMYGESDMMRFPLHNYIDIEIPGSWIKWFDNLDSQDKIQAMAVCWELCGSYEQNMVVQDLKSFFDPSNKLDAKRRHIEALAAERAIRESKEQSNQASK